MKKLILFALCGLVLTAALFCAGCGSYYGEYDYNGGASGGVNVVLGILNGKFPDQIQSLTFPPAGLPDKISVEWAPSSMADGYRVYRDRGEWWEFDHVCGEYGTDLTLLGETSSASYTDTGLTRGTTYCYGVSAYNEYGETPKFYFTAATQDVPKTPKIYSVTALSEDSIRISWNFVSGVETAAYHVYRTSTNYNLNSSYKEVGCKINTENLEGNFVATCIDTGLSPNTTYYYKVSAYNNAGESGRSAYESAKTFIHIITGTFKDLRDGKTYTTVQIGNQTWMAENLNYNKPGQSWCYAGDTTYCDKFGRLYAWDADICPSGWHLPSADEWTILTLWAEDMGGAKVLKSPDIWKTYSSGYYDYTGTNTSKFNALPGGYRNIVKNTSEGLNTFGNWWTSTPTNSSYYDEYVNNVYMVYNSNEINITEDQIKYSAFSVRCIK